MSRAVDLCTCGRHRSDHGNATDHQFFPHPQPEAPHLEARKGFERKVLDFMHTQGFVRDAADNKAFVELLNGETWEVQITLRRNSKSHSGDGV